jgi:hypothetical protein
MNDCGTDTKPGAVERVVILDGPFLGVLLAEKSMDRFDEWILFARG